MPQATNCLHGNRCRVVHVDPKSPPEIQWLKHLSVNGSLHDADGGLNLEILQVRTTELFIFRETGTVNRA